MKLLEPGELEGGIETGYSPAKKVSCPGSWMANEHTRRERE